MVYDRLIVCTYLLRRHYNPLCQTVHLSTSSVLIPPAGKFVFTVVITEPLSQIWGSAVLVPSTTESNLASRIPERLYVVFYSYVLILSAAHLGSTWLTTKKIYGSPLNVS